MAVQAEFNATDPREQAHNDMLPSDGRTSSRCSGHLQWKGQLTIPGGGTSSCS